MRKTTRQGSQMAVTVSAVGMVVAMSPGTAYAATAVTANTAFINVNAAAGKSNRITIDPSGGNVIISDSGDTVTAGAGCTQLTTARVSCPAGTRTILLTAGDLNDSVVMRAGLRATLNGGAGGDTLVATDSTSPRVVLAGDAGNDVLRGGPGDDELVGGTDGDAMSGGAGNDRLGAVDGLGGNDSSDGGAGTDACPGDVGDRETACES